MSRALIRNPNSGNRARSRRAAAIAERRGYEVYESAARNETVDLAREVAPETDLLAACGGDGTLNEVVRGVDEADALDDTVLGVVPAGTGNDFADNIGVRSVKHAFDVLDGGEERRLDLGVADAPGEVAETPDDPSPPRPFLNSCICGLTAEASAKTSPRLKKRLGVLAYVMATLQHTRSFEGLRLDVRAGPDRDRVWTGEAVMLLIGNARRFPGEERRQANVEDGRLNVVIIENRPALNYLTVGAADRLLRRGGSHLTRVTVPELVVDANEPRQFSLDGEMIQRRHLEVRSRPRAMRFKVGDAYDPYPPEP